MSNPWDQIRSALAEAKALNSAADESAGSMAIMLKGRLRHVPRWVLADLKRELRDFNIHTKEWKK